MSASSIHGKYGKVFDGHSFQDVVPMPINGPLPPPPSTAGGTEKSTIFVAIPQFRDGQRCARTLQRLFRAAVHPERVTVGLIEQTDTEHELDKTCLEEYCALEGYARKEYGAGAAHRAERQRDWDLVMEGCPRAREQIRSVRFHHYAAKGPAYARSFTRRLLGNEEFCMQIDAHTDFAQGWDNLSIQQWINTGNEYAVLSNVPYKQEKNGGDHSNAAEVPRQCAITIGSEGVPLFENTADGKAIGLTQPLLSFAQSSSFAFAKCHYEINVPHDPFAVQLLETEKFPRFARLWSRGYDTYTPSVNIVYQDNAVLHPLHKFKGHGDQGERKWPRNDKERRDAHIRMKVLLDIHHGITGAEAASLGGGGDGIGGKISAARANLGIYGLGKRRTLKQLLEFTGISLTPGQQHGNEGKGCFNPKWVPYDASISSKANLDGMADDLDPEPHFPLRTLPDATEGEGQYEHPFSMGNPAWDEITDALSANEALEKSSNVPYSLVIVLWAIGLYVWYGMFVEGDHQTKNRAGRSTRNTARSPKKKVPLAERALKNV